jgi:hypothetical protein
MPLQRFDSHRLRHVLPGQVSARRCDVTDALVAACRLGAGPATRPLLQPGEPPRIEWPFGVLHTTNAEAARRACLLLDGSWRMQDAGAAGRVAIRLQALLADTAWWRPLHDGDAWDAGIADSATVLDGFRPRRATLVLLQTSPDAAGEAVLQALQNSAHGLPRALRVLLVADGPTPPYARRMAG